MIKVDLFEKKIKRFIYGAGNKARVCATYFNDKGIDYEGFLVSDNVEIENDCITGKSIKHLSELEDNSTVGIIVAVSDIYWSEIESEIELFKKKRSACIYSYFLNEAEFFAMKREMEPIDWSKFLDKPTPGGNLMGCDRGLSISRYYINGFLGENCSRFHPQYTYEVGEDRYGSIYYPNAVHKVLNFEKGIDLTRKETLPCEEFDIFICTQVFNCIFDVRKAIEGAAYVLKEGGVLLSTVAGNISQVSRSDMSNYGDYWRFTYLGIGRLMSEVFGKDNVSVFSYGNSMATTAYTQGMCFEDLPHPELLDYSDPEYALVIGVIGKKTWKE